MGRKRRKGGGGGGHGGGGGDGSKKKMMMMAMMCMKMKLMMVIFTILWIVHILSMSVNVFSSDSLVQMLAIRGPVVAARGPYNNRQFPDRFPSYESKRKLTCRPLLFAYIFLSILCNFDKLY